MDMHDRLKSWREAAGLSQAELAEKLGTTEQSIGRYERGERPPKASHFATLAALGCDPTWLVTGARGTAAQPIPSGELTNATKIAPEHVQFIRRLDEGTLEPGEGAKIPIFDVTAAAGAGVWNDLKRIQGYTVFPTDILRQTLGVDPAHAVLIAAAGDSMEPTIKDGSLILVDTRISEMKDDAIYVLVNDHQLKVKRLQRLIGGRLRITSDNPAYTAEDLSPEQAAAIGIVGRVKIAFKPV